MAESELADHQTSRTAASTSSTEGTFRTLMCWPAKLAPALSSPTADDRTATGSGSPFKAPRSAIVAAPSPDALVVGEE